MMRMAASTRWWLISGLIVSLCSIRFYFQAIHQIKWESDASEARMDEEPAQTVTFIQDDVWRQTTQILYQNSSHLDEWLAKPPIKLYIYDTLAEEFSVEAVSTCINNKFNADKSNNCGWDPVVCNENSSGSYPYFNLYRTNFNNDVVLLKRFLRYEYITKNPSEADIFIVPYPHKSHCICRQKSHTKAMCVYSYKLVEKEVIGKLDFYNAYPSKHLFILGSDWDLANPPLRKKSILQLSLGPADGCRKRGKGPSANCGSLVVPYVNTDFEYQPKQLAELSESWWLDRERHYGLTAIMGTPAHLKVRVVFYQNATRMLGDNIGGMPIHLSTNGNDRNLKRHDIAMNIYRNSTFCPILPGDDCAQKRFFDVILSGCIPVVLRYPSDEKGWPSWFARGECSIRRAYPFGRGSFFNDENAGIDYRTFVVEIDDDCGLECMKPKLEELMSKPDTVRLLRRNLMSFARLLSYGLDEASYGYIDAFSALLVTLRHYSSFESV